MSAAELRLLWQAQKGSAPPPFATARLMRAALAWDMQAESFGGETPAARRRWEKIERARSRGASASEAIEGIALAAPVAEGTWNSAPSGL